MATWVEPIDSETDPDAPLKSELGKRWDNNVKAVSEGAVGAPKVQGQALGNVMVGFGNITNVFLNVTANIDRAKVIYGNFVCEGSNDGDLRVRLSNNNGSTWGSTQTLISNGSFSGTVNFTLDVTSGAFYAYGMADVGGIPGIVTNTGTITVPAGQVNAIGVTLDDATGNGAGAIMCLGGAA